LELPITIDAAAFAAIFGIELTALATIWGIAYAIKIAKSA